MIVFQSFLLSARSLFFKVMFCMRAFTHKSGDPLLFMCIILCVLHLCICMFIYVMHAY